jgi:hypothetical protein
MYVRVQRVSKIMRFQSFRSWRVRVSGSLVLLSSFLSSFLQMMSSILDRGMELHKEFKSRGVKRCRGKHQLIAEEGITIREVRLAKSSSLESRPRASKIAVGRFAGEKSDF